MEFVLSQLDLGFEQDVLNFNYDYVTKYIEKRQKKFPGTGKTIKSIIIFIWVSPKLHCS